MSAADQLRYDGRVAVVTGAGAGLGREYALLLGARGAKVVVNDLGGSPDGQGASKRAADVVVDEIKALGGEAVADYNSVVDGAKVIETAVKNFGRVDILINNAGILRDRSIAKTSDQDWDLVHDVHLKGSFKTTQAAWPYMKKQNYGRIVMTSSNSGVYGNFGQANYSAAKMGLIGLANTVAIEGRKYNIHCNVIIPTAASRMTQGVMPEIMFNELKPQLIAPVVGYLVHESCKDNASYIDSAAGWAAKVEYHRAPGAILRNSIEQHDIAPEYVKSNWSKVTDMAEAEWVDPLKRSRSTLMDVVEQVKSANSSTLTGNCKYGAKDLILYALGIGASLKNDDDLKYLYENHPNFSALPTFFSVPVLHSRSESNLVVKHFNGKYPKESLLHGEEYLEICDDLPIGDVLSLSNHIVEVLDKGAGGAVVMINGEAYQSNGRLLAKTQSSVFIRGAGNFGGHKKPINKLVTIQPPPNRPPDSALTYKTSFDQAALYRLSGDWQRHSIDHDVAVRSGLKAPIMHGMCTMGYSVRAVLAQYGRNEAAALKAVMVRFSDVVYPGQTLRVEMWQEGRRIHFCTVVVETGKKAITGAYVDLKAIEGAAKL